MNLFRFLEAKRCLKPFLTLTSSLLFNGSVPSPVVKASEKLKWFA